MLILFVGLSAAYCLDQLFGQKSFHYNLKELYLTHLKCCNLLLE